MGRANKLVTSQSGSYTTDVDESDVIIFSVNATNVGIAAKNISSITVTRIYDRNSGKDYNFD